MPALPRLESNPNFASKQIIIAYPSPTFASVEINVLYRGRNREKARRKLLDRAWPEFELADIDETGSGLVAKGVNRTKYSQAPTDDPRRVFCCRFVSNVPVSDGHDPPLGGGAAVHSVIVF
jgi:hypothetical protein